MILDGLLIDSVMILYTLEVIVILKFVYYGKMN